MGVRSDTGRRRLRRPKRRAAADQSLGGSDDLRADSGRRTALTRAAALVSNQAEGLRLTGSKTTEAAFREYAATLQRIADAPQTDLGDGERLQIENSSFVLEGIRDGLLTAEFRERAALINHDIRTLNNIVGAYNAAPAS